MTTNEKLDIELRTFAEIAILDCAGRIVVGSEADHLFDTVTSAMEKSRRILLNLAGVSAIDSGGLGMIVLLHRYAVNSGRELRLSNATPRVAEVFALTDLHSILDLHQHEYEAIDYFFRDVA